MKLDIVIGIIGNAKKEIFIAKRPPGTPCAGYWEFPGGKCELGETPYQALLREFQEECAVEVLDASEWMQYSYAYPDKTLQIYVYLIHDYKGEPIGNEGQVVTWCHVSRLHQRQFPPANADIISQLEKYFS